jgi:hypothetical protein
LTSPRIYDRVLIMKIQKKRGDNDVLLILYDMWEIPMVELSVEKIKMKFRIQKEVIETPLRGKYIRYILSGYIETMNPKGWYILARGSKEEMEKMKEKKMKVPNT